MTSHHANGSALRAWLDRATSDLPTELSTRAEAEIRAHVEEAQEDYIAQGLEPSEAYRHALESLGDASDVNRMYRDHFDVDLPDNTPGIRRETRETSDMKQPQLVWTSPEGQKLTFPLASAEITIGRRENSDILVPHPSTSRVHAKIIEVQGGYELVDLGACPRNRQPNADGSWPVRSRSEPGGDAHSSRAASDKEITANPHRPNGFGRNGAVFVVAPPQNE